MDKKNKWLVGVVVAVVVLALLGLGVNSYNTTKDAKLAAEQKLADATKQLGETNDKLDALSTKVDATQKTLADTQKELTTKQEEIAQLNEKLKETETKPVVVPPVAVSVNGERIDNIYVNDGINFLVDDQDLAKLQDTSIDFNDDTYEIHEEFGTQPGKVVFASSLTEDDKFGAEPHVVVERGGLVYSYVFDETVKVADITNDEPLKLNFLGQNIEIVKLDSGKAVLRSGTEVFLMTGQKTTVAGKEITLNVAGSNDNVYVCVAGECKILKLYKSEKVGGLDVRVEEVLSSEDGNGAATLVVGADTVYEQKNADGWYGNDEFKFEIVLVNSNTELKELRVVYDEARTKLNKEFKPLGLGEEVCFPNNFVCVKFDKLQNADYTDVEVSFDDLDVELANGTDVSLNCVDVKTSQDDAVQIGTNEDNEFYVCSDGQAYFDDVDGDWYAVALSSVTIENEDSVYTLQWNGGHLKFVEPTGGQIVLQTDFANEKLGTTEDESESAELQYNSIGLGDRDYSVLTLYGTVLQEPDSNGDNDEVIFSIPADALEGELLVYNK